MYNYANYLKIKVKIASSPASSSHRDCHGNNKYIHHKYIHNNDNHEEIA